MHNLIIVISFLSSRQFFNIFILNCSRMMKIFFLKEMVLMMKQVSNFDFLNGLLTFK